jgi:hypothetical protein
VVSRVGVQEYSRCGIPPKLSCSEVVAGLALVELALVELALVELALVELALVELALVELALAGLVTMSPLMFRRWQAISRYRQFG